VSSFLLVIPAKAGIQLFAPDVIPAQAGIHLALDLLPLSEAELRLAYGRAGYFLA
jgi:hypothetical protein